MNLTEVNKSIQNNLFLQETAQQLEKDFLMIGINFDIDTPVSDYKYLFSFTYHLVNALNEQNPQKVLILIYRIDLAEKKVQEEMQKTQLSFTEMLSEMIVKRELKKVLIKNYFTNS
jgi:hypothetical protein